MSGGHFIRRLAEHFGLVSDKGLMGLTMIASPRPERQLAAIVGALENVEGAHAEVEGIQADPVMVHVPQPPLAATTVVRTMP
ncbi:hypothetical protein Tco_1426889 [Tanacetum coccineum]